MAGKLNWMMVAGLLVLSACGGGKPVAVEKQEAVPVSVEPVKTMTFEIREERVGEIIPRTRAIVVPTVAGVITRTLADIGDPVKKGQLLAEIDHRAVDQQVASLEGALGAVDAKLKLLDDDAARFRRLYEQDAVSKHRLELVETERQATAETRKQLAGQLAALKERLKDYYLKAPISGRVADRMLDTGSVAGGGNPLFIIDDLSAVKVVTSVSETLMGQVRKGTPVEITIPALGRKVTAAVTAVSASVDPVTRSGKVEVLLDNQDGAIRPGMYVKAAVVAGTSNAPAVNRDALLRLPATGVYYCFVVQDGKAEKRMLTVERIAGHYQEIVDGLSEGDRVVIKGQGLLKTGTPVSVMK